MNKEIEIDLAKEQIKRINDVLESPHILIGGLAIQQYYKARNSRDIDLICESETVKKLIRLLYPSKNYDIIDKNDDEYRPSFEITDKLNDSKVIFFGPKVIEREPYMSMDWDKLKKESQPFKYKGNSFQNVRVPRMETLAFTKILAFLNRILNDVEKGEQDLVDFINLTNHSDFKINVLINHIRSAHCENFIFEQLNKIKNYNTSLWDSSLFLDFMKILFPLISNYIPDDKLNIFKDNYSKIFKVNDSIEFYDKIAFMYDERNTNYLLNTHRKIIHLIINYIKSNSNYKILDLGAGTGRLIATHFFDKENLFWNFVEPSEQMIEKLKINMESAEISYRIYNNSIFDLPQNIKNDTYDIIIISCVLTSLYNNPDFKEIIKLLNKKGIIIISDIDPCYTQMKPFYDFKMEYEKIALTPRMVYPIEIISEFLKEKMSLESVQSIENVKGEKYSYVLQFTHQTEK